MFSIRSCHIWIVTPPVSSLVPSRFHESELMCESACSDPVCIHLMGDSVRITFHRFIQGKVAPTDNPVHGVTTDCRSTALARKCILYLHKRRQSYPYRCCSRAPKYEYSCASHQELFERARTCSPESQYCSQPRMPVNEGKLMSLPHSE